MVNLIALAAASHTGAKVATLFRKLEALPRKDATSLIPGKAFALRFAVAEDKEILSAQCSH